MIWIDLKMDMSDEIGNVSFFFPCTVLYPFTFSFCSTSINMLSERNLYTGMDYGLID